MTPTPREGEIPASAIFGQTGKLKAELTGPPPVPLSRASQGRLSLCTDVHAQQTPGPRLAAPGGGEGRGQAGGAQPAGRPGRHLFSISVCTLYTRSRASCRTCFVSCRSAISERTEGKSHEPLLCSSWEPPHPQVAAQNGSGSRDAGTSLHLQTHS
jgi:hypothetical protein